MGGRVTNSEHIFLTCLVRLKRNRTLLTRSETSLQSCTKTSFLLLIVANFLPCQNKTFLIHAHIRYIPLEKVLVSRPPGKVLWSVLLKSWYHLWLDDIVYIFSSHILRSAFLISKITLFLMTKYYYISNHLNPI